MSDLDLGGGINYTSGSEAFSGASSANTSNTGSYQPQNTSQQNLYANTNNPTNPSSTQNGQDGNGTPASEQVFDTSFLFENNDHQSTGADTQNGEGNDAGEGNGTAEHQNGTPAGAATGTPLEQLIAQQNAINAQIAALQQGQQGTQDTAAAATNPAASASAPVAQDSVDPIVAQYGAQLAQQFAQDPRVSPYMTYGLTLSDAVNAAAADQAAVEQLRADAEAEGVDPDAAEGEYWSGRQAELSQQALARRSQKAERDLASMRLTVALEEVKRGGHYPEMDETWVTEEHQRTGKPVAELAKTSHEKFMARVQAYISKGNGIRQNQQAAPPVPITRGGSGGSAAVGTIPDPIKDPAAFKAFSDQAEREAARRR